MARILKLGPTVVVITLSLLLVSGCTGASGGPREQADKSISEANGAIADHDRLFGEARDAYEGARKAVEDGQDPEAQAKRVARAREELTQARAKLEEGRGPLLKVRNLDVEPKIKEYAGLVSGAMDSQLKAEAGEIEFYKTLEGDPILEKDRRKALDTLSRAGDDYAKAEAAYARSKKLADANPELIGG